MRHIAVSDKRGEVRAQRVRYYLDALHDCPLSLSRAPLRGIDTVRDCFALVNNYFYRQWLGNELASRRGCDCLGYRADC